MIYRNDDSARAERADSLIDEIAKLEREKVNHATSEQRLDAAKRELSTLQVYAPSAPRGPGPGLVVHVLVFGATAAAAYVGYTLLI